MTPRPGETGAALLSVLLLVAVMATVSATALDRLSVTTRLAGNSVAAGQARWWVATAELLTSARLEDLLAADSSRTVRGLWLGTERTIALPDGGAVRVRVEDGGNCFNLNGLVEERAQLRIARPAGARQFEALMGYLGIAGAEAARIAAAATAKIDSASGSGEMMVDPSELRTVPGVDARQYRLLEPWLCALPTAELSPLNVNTLRPDQAPLLAMLDPARLDLARARAQIAGRPAAGFATTVDFWNSPVLAGVAPGEEAARQIRLRSEFFDLRVTVAAGDVELDSRSLLDARALPIRVVRREFGEGA